MKYIILAGGKGSRLKEVVDVKPMADINGKPFLECLIEFLKKFGVKEVVLSVGYKKEKIINYFGKSFKGVNITYAIEDTPLLTGGAIKNVDFDEAIILNGDTYFDVNLNEFIEFSKDSDISICVKEMENSDRYGAVKVRDGYVVGFEEKKFYKKCLINGGIYYLKREVLKDTPKVFMFEEFLQRSIGKYKIKAYKSDGFFIDIGIPKDYFLARKALSGYC